MPILEVEIVLKPGELLTGDIAARLAGAAGAIFASRPRGTWVRVRALDAALYAENDAGASPGVFPVFVSVLKSELDVQRMQDEASRLAEAISGICNRPMENVHVLFEPAARGRIAFGGIL